MKKSFIALAVMSAFASAAYAQTSIAIYGIVDAGIVYENDSNPAGKTWRLDSGQQSGSRLGFRGTEDMGAGLSAIFTLENGFNSDTGTQAQGGRLFGRQSWVGLKGTFGDIKLGRQLSPLYTATDQIDPFKIGLAGNAQRAFGYGLYNTDPFLRTDNTISYSMPDYSGLTGTASYAFGEVPGRFSNLNSYGIRLGYINGPINIQGAYQRSNTVTLTGGTTAAPTATALSAIFGPVGDVKTGLIGGSYDFGPVKGYLTYVDTKVEAPLGASQKNRNYLVGVSAPVGGVGNVMASWIRNDVRDVNNGKSDQYALGYTHALSKRTNLYTSYAHTKNNSGVRLNSAVNGGNDNLFNVGMRHLF